VSASFVGKRNYSVAEIKQAVAEGIVRREGWIYTEDDTSADINVRLFIEHDIALVGVRLRKQPLHRRSYERITQPGSLKPPIAAAMVFLATHYNSAGRIDPFLIDPCCGSGIIPVEAAQMGIQACAGDVSLSAVRTTQHNAWQAQVNIQLSQWDACSLPLAAESVNCLVSNLPWGVQASPTSELSQFYAKLFDELNRIMRPNGNVVLLTTIPIQYYFRRLYCVQKFEISLFGQTPTLWQLTAR
jgi:23S rRNA G2445 N2-methylase RlmL